MNAACAACPHVSYIDVTSLLGVNDGGQPYHCCGNCAAAKIRALLSGNTPREIVRDLYLQDADEETIRALLLSLVEQIDSLKTGARIVYRERKALVSESRAHP